MRRAMKPISLLLCLGLMTVCAVGDPIENVRWIPLTPIEKQALQEEKIHMLPLPFTPYNVCRPRMPHRREILADRNEYLADDPVGQFVVCLIGENHRAPGARLHIEVVGGDDKVVASKTLSPMTEPKVAFLLATGQLAAGNYRVCARLENVPNAQAIAECAFVKSKEARKVLPFPADGVPLLVHAQNHVPDASWPITTGVPLPRQASDSIDRFVLMENGKPVPAQFTQRATWYPTGMVKWMGLDFQAKYDGGKPRDYRLTRLPQGTTAPAIASPLKLSETANEFTVETGAIRFKVGRRRFAGIEEVALLNADGSAGKPIVSGAGGPFLIDERNFHYSAASDPNVSVTVEEAGPVRVTLCAKGWYQSDDLGEKCCLFTTRISAFAGQPMFNISHTTVITFDTDKKKLRGLGFEIKPVGSEQWAMGGDGKPFFGYLPFPGKDAKGKPLPPDSVWLHQDRWDHFRLMQAEDQLISAGKKSDGWAAVTSPGGTMSVSARNVWQLYPKEFELSRDAVNLHFWPRHGHVAFSNEEELDRRNIYKIFHAHEGKYLDLKFPQKYFDAMRVFGPALEQQDINALTGNGLGLAVSNDFSLHFQTPPRQPAELAARAALFQQNPHAITDPVWNGLTEVEGRFAGRDTKRFPEVERIFDEGFHGFTMSVDYLENYGMWIWPDTHNNWSPVSRQPEWHRWWLNSHYQNVWEGQFLYWRSGTEWLYQWAMNNTRHFMDVSTVNYDDPEHPMMCKLAGANYHVKGFTPWGTPRDGERCGDDYVEVGGHFINPDASLFRYLLFGDHRGWELNQAWAHAFDRVTTPPERSRENVTTLGEMLSYYVNTWDAQAILHIRELADEHNSRPWKESPAFPGHNLFHDRWTIRYWDLTRDPKLQQRVLEWFEPDYRKSESISAYPQVRAQVWQWTGRKEYLTEFLPTLTTMWDGIYLNPDDPLNYYGGRRHFFPSHSFGQMGPYYLQALIDAGLATIPPREYVGTSVAKTTPLQKDRIGPWMITGQNIYWAAKVGYFQPTGADPVVTLEIAGQVSNLSALIPNSVLSSNVHIEDADGKLLLDTSVLYGSQRPSVSLTLDARKQKAPWKIYKGGNDPLIKWSGAAEQLFLGPTPEAVKEAAASAVPIKGGKK